MRSGKGMELTSCQPHRLASSSRYLACTIFSRASKLQEKTKSFEWGFEGNANEFPDECSKKRSHVPQRIISISWVRKSLGQHAKSILLMSRIENQVVVANYDEVLAKCLHGGS